MKKYRKRSDIVVEARQVTNDPVQAGQLAKWCESIAYASPGRVSIHVSTLEGLMVAHPGDYIIKGVKGEFYPCRQDIFEETYEEVKP